MESSSPRLVLMASGNGSNAQAVIDACAAGDLPAEVVAVVSDQPSAHVLHRARVAGIEAIVIARMPGEDRRGYDARLADDVGALQPDHVVLLGWMRILTSAFLDRFPGRVINLHPALPGELPGTHAIERAFAEFEADERTHTGVMVHLVPDEGVDDGPVLATTVVPIHADDTVDTFARRMHAAEHLLIITTLAAHCRDPKEIHA
ncbi:MAG: phosphoribosylglycinamide formyltransferase [Ilumatobacteraceae bacterium]